MAIYFVSSADGNDSDNGTTLDLAWATLEHALESGALSAGDSVAIRRTHSEIPTSDIGVAYNGTIILPIKVFGCPRDAHAISSSDWTNGSTSVTVDDADMDREQHQARYITAPDGETYIITRVISSTSIVIDREYAGSTVNNNATASIQADNTQDDWDNYSDSSDTIKKSDWESDADDVPLIDFNDGNFNMYFAPATFNSYFVFENIEFKDSSDTFGIISFDGGGQYSMVGCLVKQSTQNECLISMVGGPLLSITRSTIEGNGSGGFQRALNSRVVSSSFLFLKDSAVYNMGDNGIRIPNVFIENSNIGVEIANGDADISIDGTSGINGNISGRDVKLGGTNGYVSMLKAKISDRVSFENYQKILGDHKVFFQGGEFERVAVSGETPNKKVSDYVVKISPNLNNPPSEEFHSYKIIEHELEMTADTHTFRYWIYNDTGATLNDTAAKDDIWLQAEYIKEYDDTSEYVIKKAFSTQIDILDAADADDWDYLEVTVTTAIAGKVRLTLYLNYYNATTNIFIDPAVVIT